MSLKAVVNTSVAGENGVFNTVAIGGATIGSNALAVTGTALFNSNVTLQGAALIFNSGGSVLNSGSNGNFIFGNNSGSTNTTVSFPAANTWQFGNADAASPVAQTLRVQSVVAGTAAANGANWTLQGSLGTGTGTPGKVLWNVGIAQASGTAQSTPVLALSLVGAVNGQLPSVVIGGSGANATNATDGFLYIPTSAGQPTGTPTTQGTATVALQYDTTNHQFWIYDGGWKQPKTPAGAATVTWQ